MSVKITSKDNTKEFERAFQNALERGLEAIGMAAETYAKTDGDMPVVTGYARNSITYALAGQEPNTKEYKADKKDNMKKSCAPVVMRALWTAKRRPFCCHRL